jgi:uncharacterized membrane protein
LPPQALTDGRAVFEVSYSVEIGRPPEVVFAFAGDYANDPAWRKGVLGMAYETPGPPAVGTRTRETMRSLGSTAVTIAEVTEYSPTRTAFRSLSGPIPCTGSREFASTSTGTRFTYSLTLRPAGVFRVLEPLLKRVLTGQIQADVRRLKQRLEADPK